MKLQSFIISISDFFSMSANTENKLNFQKLQYIIPKYQREYKWSTQKITTFYHDILNRDKFIGNIILNKTTSAYEIVDGQQRLTTILLIMVALFNHDINRRNNDLSEEQKELLTYLSNNDLHSNIIIENESIGKYLLLKGNEILISIEKDKDIYFQKDSFVKAYDTITEELSNIKTSSELINFQNKLLACNLSVLVGEKETVIDSIEELFLDINFKSQLLDVENIFKGYCFKNYFIRSHNELKEQWIKIKTIIKNFETIGYNNTNSNYFYLYLLSLDNTNKITQDLTIDGKHYLDNKTPTETQNIVLDMISYGENILQFISNLKRFDYLFEDICENFKNYKSNTHINNFIKKLFLDIILYKGAQYYKLPLFIFIHKLKTNEQLRQALSYDDLRKIVSNYYVYSYLFLSKRKDKNKNVIDRNIFEKLNALSKGEIDEENCIKSIVSTTKSLRTRSLDNYSLFRKFDNNKAFAFYSILDNYILSSNHLDGLYKSDLFTKEHLLIHNNKNSKITWNDTIKISAKDLLDATNTFKNATANYIILPKKLNENIDQKDIIEKIKIIKQYYADQKLPKHIKIFFAFIESMPEYKSLSKLKQKDPAKKEIESGYKKFLEAYFSNESQEQLYKKLEEEFKNIFISYPEN